MEEFTGRANHSTATLEEPSGGEHFIHINEVRREVAGAFGAWLLDLQSYMKYRQCVGL